MSRHSSPTPDGGHVEYGYDERPFPGYFYHKYDRMGSLEDGGDTRKMCILTEETDHMNRSEILEKLEEFEVPDDHIEAVAMDLTF